MFSEKKGKKTQHILETYTKVIFLNTEHINMGI